LILRQGLHLPPALPRRPRQAEVGPRPHRCRPSSAESPAVGPRSRRRRRAAPKRRAPGGPAAPRRPGQPREQARCRPARPRAAAARRQTPRRPAPARPPPLRLRRAAPASAPAGCSHSMSCLLRLARTCSLLLRSTLQLADKISSLLCARPQTARCPAERRDEGARTAQALGGARSRIQRGRRAPPRRPRSWPGRAHAALARHPLQRLGDLQARDALSARPRAARSAARRATATQHAAPSRGADLCGSSAQRCALVGACLHSAQAGSAELDAR